MAFANSIHGFWSAIAEGSRYACGAVFNDYGAENRWGRWLGGSSTMDETSSEHEIRCQQPAAEVLYQSTADSCSQRRSSGKDRISASKDGLRLNRGSRSNR
jgi:hypothetical protein